MITFSLAEFEAYNNGRLQRSGKYLRGKCHLHGGDNQESGQYNPATGHYKCHQCGAYGYDHGRAARASSPSAGHFPRHQQHPTIKPVRHDLGTLMASYRAALPGSQGEEYLKNRGISLELAQRYGWGYAQPGAWAGRAACRSWSYGGIVIPHHDPAGTVINLYCRLVGEYEKIPEKVRPTEKVWKSIKHDHLSGNKGIFNAMALSCGAAALCEGPFDALALIAAGYENACAIFGVNGISGRWEWVKASILTFCFDNDAAGSKKWKQLADEAYNKGRKVFYLEPAIFGAHKDLSEVWTKTGFIDISGMPEPAIMEPEPCIVPTPAQPGPAPWQPASYLEAIAVRITTLQAEIEWQAAGLTPATSPAYEARYEAIRLFRELNYSAFLLTWAQEHEPDLYAASRQYWDDMKAAVSADDVPATIEAGVQWHLTWKKISTLCSLASCRAELDEATAAGRTRYEAQTPPPEIREYDQETADLITWFNEHRDTLPAEPFSLDEVTTILSPAGWYAAIDIDIAAGPEYIRARRGLIKSDIEKLKEKVTS